MSYQPPKTNAFRRVLGAPGLVLVLLLFNLAVAFTVSRQVAAAASAASGCTPKTESRFGVIALALTDTG